MTATLAARPAPTAPAPAPAPAGAGGASGPVGLVRPDRSSVVRRRRRLVAALTAVIGAFALFGLVTAHVVLSQTQIRLEKLDEAAAEEQARFDQLRLQVAELESPERVVATAQELGMVAPPIVHYLAPVVPAPAEPATTGSAPADAAAPAAGWSTVKPHLSTAP